MKAFIGRSFEAEDKLLIISFYEFFNSLKNLDFKFIDAFDMEQGKISEKIKSKIDESDFFIGIITAKKPIMPKGLLNRIRNKTELFTPSNWTVQESGYAHGQNKNVILIIEDNVDVPLTDILGDQEKIIFNRNKLQECFVKCNQVILDTVTKIKSKKGLLIESDSSLTDKKSIQAEEKDTREDDGIKREIMLLEELNDAVENKSLEETKIVFQRLILNAKEKGNPFSEIEEKRIYLWDLLRKMALRGFPDAYDELRNGAMKKEIPYVTTFIEVVKNLSGAEKAIDLIKQFEDVFSGENLVNWNLFKAKIYLDSDGLENAFNLYSEV